MDNKILVIRIKLFLVFFLGVVFVFINELPGAIIIFVIGVLVFLFTKKTKSQTVLALSAFVTGAMMIVYNIVFSPKEGGGAQWFIFTINDLGINRGLVTGLRSTGTMLVSFSWLFTTSLHDIYLSLCWVKRIEPWLLVFLRGIQLFRVEVQSIVRSLLIRGLKWDSLKANIKNLLPLASVIIPRSLDITQSNTLAYLTHKKSER